MTDTQLYLAVGIPTVAVLLGILMNGLLYNSLSTRMSTVEARMLSLENTFTARFDILMGVLSEVQVRIGVLEGKGK
jgi:hypothetical protein